MSVEKIVQHISEQVRKERALGLHAVNESAEHFKKVMKEVDHAEENMHDGSHDFHSKDDHKTTVKKLVSHLKKAGHRDVKVEAGHGKNDTYVSSTHSSGEEMSHNVTSTPHKDGGHEHEVYTSVTDNRH